MALPFDAKVVFQGCERRMMAKQIVATATSATRQIGANAAKGRIVLP